MERTRPLPINHRLREARLGLGLTAKDTAEAIGYTREHLSKFENGFRRRGRDYSPAFIRSLASFLFEDVSVEEMFDPKIAPLPASQKYRKPVQFQ